MKKILFLSFALIFVSFLTLSSIILAILWKYSPELPGYDKIVNYKPNLSSRLYSSDGILLKSFHKEERLFIPIERIPKKIIYAFISAEDKNFFNHIGIDLYAIFRASISNLINSLDNKKLIGASTITQQVVKNLLLSNEVSYERKIKEILLSLRIENILSKEEILELYLNDIYLGYRSYGIASASLNYFNKSLSDLDLSEIAFLASLPKAPNNYNPKKNYNAAVERRNWVLDRMYANKFIKKDDLNYKNNSIILYSRSSFIFNEADYFYEEIRKKLFNKYGEKKFYSDGLIIKTSLDSKLQKIANEALVQGLIDYDKRRGWRGAIRKVDFENYHLNNFISQFNNPFPNKWKIVEIKKIKKNLINVSDVKNKNMVIDLNSIDNKWLKKEIFSIGEIILVENIKNNLIIRQIPEVNGAIIVLNPHTGDILAMSGGLSFNLSQFNRSTQAKRQPGSAFKPFVYIAALNEGLNPSTLVLDAPYVIDQGPGLPKWKPANYTDEFYGLTTIRTGIEKSRNLMTIRLANEIGIPKILETAKNFGIDKYLDDNLSMSLGSGLVNLIDITNAYGIIANGGKKIQPNFVQSIYNKEGKQIFKSTKKNCDECFLKKINKNMNIPNIKNNDENILDPKIAYQITSMMEGVVQRGTAIKLKALDLTLAGKTGTTNKNKDAWFIGYSPDIAVGIFVGYDQPKSLGYKETGSSVAVPIFKNYAINSEINKNNKPFRIPNGITFINIDPNTGMPSNSKNAIMEPFIKFSENVLKNEINVIDSLGYSSENISGTGGLLNN
ncbi:PBP1A family penicillin-binding protein [Pelagibacteraceae bacterium]|nr:PBP1A family penicillin-binding protein [Pelagibacteraceae bacterium]